MKDTFEKNEKKSIRNIPIPSRTEKEAIDQKMIAAEQELIESIVHKAESEEIVQDEPVISIPIKKTRTKSQSMDGIKRAGGRKKKVEPIAVTPEIIEEEIVPPRKSIDKTKIEHVPYKVEPAFVDRDTIDEEVEEGDDLSVQEETYESWSKHEKKGYVFWIMCGAIAAVFLFGISYLFSGATITLTPKKYDVSVESTKVYLSDVTHKKVSATASDELTVTVSGTVKVDRKATGTVVLYNSFSSGEQKLIAGTRLETTGGKIFRLKDAVTIPGQKTVSGKKVPGSVQASIEASETGESYNVGYQDFKLPAYKGTPRYDSIYARSKDSVGNGYSGEVPNLGNTGISSSTKDLKDKLLTQALEKIKGDLPNGFALIPESYIAEYGKIDQSVSKDGTKVTFKGSVTVTALLLSPEALSKSILKAENMIGTSTTTSQQAQYSGDVSSLKVQLPKDTLVSDFDTSSKMYMTVTGTTSIYSMVSQDTVAQAVSRLQVDRATPVLKELTDSDSVEISIWPWWSNVLPGKDKIRLKIK